MRIFEAARSFLTASGVAMSLSLVSTQSYAQSDDDPSGEIAGTTVAPSPEGLEELAMQIIGDYPSRAISMGLEGTVGVQVTVSPEGSITRCVVTGSSGHAILDASACDTMQRHARFRPARNFSGEAIEGTFSTSVVYALN